MNQAVIKRTLFLGSTVIIGMVLGFLWLLNINQAAELKQTFLLYVAILWVFSAAAFWIFYYKGSIFRSVGGIERNRIVTVMVCILVIVQITFVFASSAYRMMNFSFLAFDRARGLYASVNWDESPSVLSGQLQQMALPDEIDALYLLDNTSTVIYAKPVIPTDGALPGYPRIDTYFFPLSGGSLVMHLSKSHQFTIIRRIMLDLFTILVVSLFLGLELVLLVIRIIETKIYTYKNISEEYRDQPRRTPDHCVNFLRQVSFLFYFASCLASAFIPVLASQLAASALARGGVTDGGIAAGIPQSVESLFTCISIFLTSEMIIKFGWKQPFLFGLVFVMAGNLLSSFTDSIIVFAAARAVVGFGYGFCWMTLRNISLFGISEKERSWAYAMFLAGLYAGQNCGQVMGSILAETLGYKMVLVIAALATGLSGILVLLLKNDRLDAAGAAAERKTEEKTAGRFREIIQAVIFIALFMVPACISGSFASYYLPVYVTNTGGSIADVGRVLLLYSLVIVYGGPKITELCQKHLGKRSYSNFWYNVILACSFLFFGLTGGFGAIAVSVVMLGLADGFGFGAQKDSFLSLRLISRMPQSKGLSWFSFLMKLAAMLGPIVFALSLGFGNRGILFISILFFVTALLAILCLRSIERPPRSLLHL